MGRTPAKLFWVSGEYITQTPKAFLLMVDGEEHWLPKSYCTLESATVERHDPVSVVVPDWLIKSKGIDDEFVGEEYFIHS